MTPEQLQARLCRFAVSVCSDLRTPRRDPATDYATSQLIRSSTSPGASYSEAMDAESRRDFIHKLKLCLKELRETLYWLQFKAALAPSQDEERLIQECRELIAIFIASLKNARN